MTMALRQQAAPSWTPLDTALQRPDGRSPQVWVNVLKLDDIRDDFRGRRRSVAIVRVGKCATKEQQGFNWESDGS